MKLKNLCFAVPLAFLVAGCAPPRHNPYVTQPVAVAPQPKTFTPIGFTYDPKAPEATNFAKQLRGPAFQCELESTTGGYAVRYGNQVKIAESTEILSQCRRDGYAQANEAVERLKAAKVSQAQNDLAKDLYAKWSTYMDSLSVYQRTDLRAQAAYESAASALATEVKFSK